ncbi:hypothetical protein LCGC14_1251410 [marine sediment metagenome]|uniref:Uncharacterized protein n=1 Tax=marine sediment metagenome TaxID=412755 RepID=A0A0F9NK24_9ZZZZ
MDTGMGIVMLITNKCCCCGGNVLSRYEEGDEVGKAFAEVTDVCVGCFKAGCRVLTGNKCEVTGKKQVQLSGYSYGGR